MDKIRNLAAAALLILVAAMPLQQAAAQSAVGGAIIGGTAGALIGGALTGRGTGVAIGAVIGATAGAIIAQEGRLHRGRYYWWRDACFRRRADGAWVRVARRHCF